MAPNGPGIQTAALKRHFPLRILSFSYLCMINTGRRALVKPRCRFTIPGLAGQFYLSLPTKWCAHD